MAAEQQQAKVEAGTSPAPAPAPVAAAEVPSNDDVVILKNVESEITTSDDSKALVVVPNKKPVPERILTSRGSLDRDESLAKLEKERKLSYVKAWEDNEKSKIDNRSEKHLTAVTAWEDKKKAALFAQLKKQEEQYEKKKAACAEKMKNKVASLHREAEEKRAEIEAKRGGEFIKIDEMAAKFRATGTTPKKSTIGCF